MSVTIKDIAKATGVSHSTVSRAMRGSSLISEETTKRIKETALNMGYFPSAAARSLKTNRSQALGIIVSNIDDPYFSEILQGIEEIGQNNNYSLFIAASQRDPEREASIVQAMRQHRVDGVIICSTNFSDQQSKQFSKYGIPIVVINNQAAEDYRYSIYHDDMDGSRQLTRHLIKLGHRKIAYLGYALSGRTNMDRLAGFRHEMESAHLTIPPGYIHQITESGLSGGLSGADHFLRLAERPTALVCYNDMLAIGVIRGLRQAGVSIPQEISVTGFDNIDFSAFTDPPLTTFDQPKYFIGAEATRLLLNLLNTTSLEETSRHDNVRILKGKLLLRESTAPPPAAH